MPTERVSHDREQLVGKGPFFTRPEPLEQRDRDRGRRHAEVESLLKRPSALAGIDDVGLDPGEIGILVERGRREVE